MVAEWLTLGQALANGGFAIITGFLLWERSNMSKRRDDLDEKRIQTDLQVATALTKLSTIIEERVSKRE